MALKAGRVGVAPSEVTATGKIKSSGTVPDATTTSKGIVQVGTGLAVASGVISAPDATTTTKGIVQVGSGLSVASGVASVAVASASAAGGLYVSFDSSTATLNLSTTPITEGGE